MVDIENDVYAIVSNALKVEIPGVFTSGEYVDSPARFPAAVMFQGDSSTFQRMRTLEISNAERISFMVYVYSNMVGYRKSEAKEIMDVIDREMARLKFTRMSCTPVANIADSTIYQLVARYEAIVDTDLRLYAV